MALKDFFGTLIGTVFGGELLQQVGNTSSFPNGLRQGTQAFIGLGVMGNAAKRAKDAFRIK